MSPLDNTGERSVGGDGCGVEDVAAGRRDACCAIGSINLTISGSAGQTAWSMSRLSEVPVGQAGRDLAKPS